MFPSAHLHTNVIKFRFAFQPPFQPPSNRLPTGVFQLPPLKRGASWNRLVGWKVAVRINPNWKIILAFLFIAASISYHDRKLLIELRHHYWRSTKCSPLSTASPK